MCVRARASLSLSPSALQALRGVARVPVREMREARDVSARAAKLSRGKMLIAPGGDELS